MDTPNRTERKERREDRRKEGREEEGEREKTREGVGRNHTEECVYSYTIQFRDWWEKDLQ